MNCMVESWTFVPRNEESIDRYAALMQDLLNLALSKEGKFIVKGAFYLEGAVTGHEHAEDGSGIKTSNIVAVAKSTDSDTLYAKTTSGSIYGFDFTAGSDLSLMGFEELQQAGEIEHVAYPRI